jgi:hypothetical protein
MAAETEEMRSKRRYRRTLFDGVAELYQASRRGYPPAPAHLIYLVLLGALAAQAASVLGMRETAPSRPGALRSLVPDIRLPRAVRSEVAIAAPLLFAVWALAGFYGSLGPALGAIVLHSSSVVYGGLSLFILAGVASGSVLVFNRAKADPSSTWASQCSSRASR